MEFLKGKEVETTFNGKNSELIITENEIILNGEDTVIIKKENFMKFDRIRNSSQAIGKFFAGKEEYNSILIISDSWTTFNFCPKGDKSEIINYLKNIQS